MGVPADPVKASVRRADLVSMWWIWVAACLVVAVVGVGRARRRGRRQRALLIACHDAGLKFSVLDPFDDTSWLPFPLFSATRSPEVRNVVWDGRDDTAVRVFDLAVDEVVTDEDGISQRRRLSCAAVPLPFACPRLSIAARGAPDPAGLPTAGDEIRLELDAFNQRFVVRAADPRAAVAFCDQRMMRALMALPLDVTVHVNEHVMFLAAPTLEAGETLVLLEAARGLARSVPSVVASLYPPRPARGPHEDRWLQGAWSPAPTANEPPPAST